MQVTVGLACPHNAYCTMETDQLRLALSNSLHLIVVGLAILRFVIMCLEGEHFSDTGYHAVSSEGHPSSLLFFLATSDTSPASVYKCL